MTDPCLPEWAAALVAGAAGFTVACLVTAFLLLVSLSTRE